MNDYLGLIICEKDARPVVTLCSNSVPQNGIASSECAISQGAAATCYMIVTSFLTSVYIRPDDHGVRRGSFDILPRQTCDRSDNGGDPRH